MYLRDMLISIEPCTLRALFGSHNIAKNVCSGYMYIILYQTFVPLSRGKMQDVYFSAHLFCREKTQNRFGRIFPIDIFARMRYNILTSY